MSLMVKMFVGSIIDCYIEWWVRVRLCVGNGCDEFIPGNKKLEKFEYIWFVFAGGANVMVGKGGLCIGNGWDEFIHGVGKLKKFDYMWFVFAGGATVRSAP